MTAIPESRYFIALLSVDAVFLALATWLYKGKFLFWAYPFSYLGTAYSVDGARNAPSVYIYSAGMLISGLIMFALALRNYYRHLGDNGLMKTLLCLFGGLGFVIAGFSPDDTVHRLHVLGSAMSVSALWIMATADLSAIRKGLSRLRYALGQLALQVPIFAYAFATFGEIVPLDAILQKIVLLIIAVVIIDTTTMMERREVGSAPTSRSI